MSPQPEKAGHRAAGRTHAARASADEAGLAAAVFRAAGRTPEFFDHAQVHYRLARRVEVRIPAAIRVVLHNGVLRDSGTATVRNISASGALLAEVRLPRQSYPVSPFKFEILMHRGAYAGLTIEAQPVRFVLGHRGVGVKFSEVLVPA